MFADGTVCSTDASSSVCLMKTWSSAAVVLLEEVIPLLCVSLSGCVPRCFICMCVLEKSHQLLFYPLIVRLE